MVLQVREIQICKSVPIPAIRDEVFRGSGYFIQTNAGIMFFTKPILLQSAFS